MKLSQVLALSLPVVAASFGVFPGTTIYRSGPDRIICFSSENQPEEPSLVLGEDLDSQMARLRSKYPTSEADYLAAARKRAAERRESVNDCGSDEDWQKVAAEKRGLSDDWEESLKEAGNVDSQILIPVEPSTDENGEEEEPKLMLF